MHGIYRISVSGRVAISMAIGPNNDEGFYQYIEDLKAIIIDRLIGSDWAILALPVQTVIVPPDSIQLMSDFEKWRAENGLNCIAWSFEYVRECPPLIESNWKKAYGATDPIPKAYFRTTAEAVSWLKSNGYDCELSPEDREFIESARD